MKNKEQEETRKFRTEWKSIKLMNKINNLKPSNCKSKKKNNWISNISENKKVLYVIKIEIVGELTKKRQKDLV